ncbi:MAG TPA: outer membrane beta-barrel domain-containing protein [Myxococcota bacterium]|nr:outer membrane beta-barrel domain-containing protein [Myxococcota bacterium]HNZ02738.1 outer membrane beta-barrel domain-containing protein [Myxococcota bacterium]HOD06921.1 outer membrane beta-barrel domain-containing protein [Myxococcota bacterium]HPB50752.1 outer membrane beta-barrel domain-containing protein [Myxococcota bacterium]HQP94658.1 outer membrane beta-barrel domain-containing protein [Myxococcota bacterium]
MRTRVFAAFLFAIVAMVGSAAFAQDKASGTDEGILVLQQKPFIKAMRFEIEPTFNLPMNETVTQHVGVGVQLRFHIKDWVAVGAEYIKYFGWSKDDADGALDNYVSYARLMDFYVGANVSFVPLTGKFLWLGQYGKPVYWDIYMTAGAGAAKTLFGDYHGSGNVGFGFRLAATQWLTVNFEIRDYMYMENYALEDKFVNNVVFSLGLGFFMPFKHTYVHPK